MFDFKTNLSFCSIKNFLKNFLFVSLYFTILSCSPANDKIETLFGEENDSVNENKLNGTLTFNGYTYKTVVIGDQEWLAENLKTNLYNDGTLIAKLTDNTQWSTTTIGALCAYGNNDNNVLNFGYLYNWHAVNTGKLAPTGWRVPTDEDWTILTNYVGESNAGTKLKAKSGWGVSGTDDFGFKALPGGLRDMYSASTFNYMGSYGGWWSSSSIDQNYGRHRSMGDLDNFVYRGSGYGKSGGFSVRLVKGMSTRVNVPPLEPLSPSPGNGAVDQSVSISVSWSCSDPDGDALTYDVYFGTNQTPTTIVSANQTAKTFTPTGLTTNTIYYWKIVVKDSKGATTTGPIWNFKTVLPPNNAPSAPSNPSPASNLTTLQPTTVSLSWSCSDPDGDALTYDVYFGTSPTPSVIVSANQTAKNYAPPGLTNNTIYYWKIVAKDSKGATTEGPLWNFKTLPSYDFTFDGHLYKTVVIGTQVWTIENLQTTKYNDGTSITKITTDNSAWTNNTTGAYCTYDNNESNVATYGYLYNWYAVNTDKLAPTGWRVPTDADWTKLTEFAGGAAIAGTKLKSKTGWSTNTGTDIYGFCALPGGGRYNSGSFLDVGNYGFWWSSTPDDTDYYAWYRYMYYYGAYMPRNYSGKSDGFSVRLVRDL